MIFAWVVGNLKAFTVADLATVAIFLKKCLYVRLYHSGGPSVWLSLVQQTSPERQVRSSSFEHGIGLLFNAEHSFLGRFRQQVYAFVHVHMRLCICEYVCVCLDWSAGLVRTIISVYVCT